MKESYGKMFKHNDGTLVFIPEKVSGGCGCSTIITGIIVVLLIISHILFPGDSEGLDKTASLFGSAGSSILFIISLLFIIVPIIISLWIIKKIITSHLNNIVKTIFIIPLAFYVLYSVFSLFFI